MKTLVKHLLALAGLEVRRINRIESLDLYPIFASLSARPTRLGVIQVGANDGVSNDPIFSSVHRFVHKILLIEPQQEVAQLLLKNYADFTGIVDIETRAVCDEKSIRLFRISGEAGHRVSSANASGITSSNKAHVERYAAKYLGDAYTPQSIMPFDVDCVKLGDLIAQHFATMDLFLQIDAEGADWAVIQTLGGERPMAINFETKHLDRRSHRSAVAWLRDEGYEIFDHGGDCLAIRSGRRHELNQ